MPKLKTGDKQRLSPLSLVATIKMKIHRTLIVLYHVKTFRDVAHALRYVCCFAGKLRNEDTVVLHKHRCPRSRKKRN